MLVLIQLFTSLGAIVMYKIIYCRSYRIEFNVMLQTV